MRLNTFHDERFHYYQRDNGYFEGWYFRLTDAEGRNAFALIPGVSGAKGDEHSFIMALEGEGGRSSRLRLPLAAFRATDSPFSLDLGCARFSLKGIEADFGGDIPVHGKLAFSEPRPWRGTFLNPRAMGWFGYLPFLQCYHGVLSFSHRIDGYLEIAGRRVDYSGGRGYMEKDWGSAFPSAWVWAQSAHFEDASASAMISVATIPFLGSSFRGFIFGLDCAAGFFRFATYTGAKIASFASGPERADILIRGNGLEVEIKAGRGVSQQEALFFPADKGLMTGLVTESLDAELSIRIKNRKGGSWATLWEGTGSRAGMELSGDMEAQKE